MVELVWDGKYDAQGKRVAPPRLRLPFQTVETVNEDQKTRNLAFDLFSTGRPAEWRNRLIWGDKKYVLPALLDEFAGKVDLIYIDPPFATDADFSIKLEVGDQDFVKEPSIIEQKAYRDTWGRGHDSYLQWCYEGLVILHQLLSESGSIYVHVDWHVGHYVKLVLDEVFGSDNFMNEITWNYYNKLAPISQCFPRASDRVLAYAKSFGKHKFHKQEEVRDKPVKQLKRKFVDGRAINVRDEEGNVLYQEKATRRVDDVWRIPMLQPADKTENLRYPTQKPEALLERIIRASSDEGDLVLDCFAGSGTTAAVAEKLGRRWITCDLGRFAIHTTRKRLLSIDNVRPFVVQNLGKYERQAWQVAEFGDAERAAAVSASYRNFILDLYRAEPLPGYTWLHGRKAGRMVHVGAVDAPIAPSDINQIAIEFRKLMGTGKDAPGVNAVDVLGWDFAFDLNEVARQKAAEANLTLRFVRIPREVLEKRAVEQGDIRFFELAALAVEMQRSGRSVTVRLTDFVIPPDDVPADIQAAITHWSQWIDYWAVDWDNQGDTFHNMWQTYRTRQEKSLAPQAAHTYTEPGSYTILIKVIDILGNDTTRALRVEIAGLGHETSKGEP